MEYLLGISAFIISGLLTWVGYYLKEFATTVKDLKSAVEQLKVVLSVEQEKVNNLRETLLASNTALDGRINNLSTKVDQNTSDILVLKTMHDPTKQSK